SRPRSCSRCDAGWTDARQHLALVDHTAQLSPGASQTPGTLRDHAQIVELHLAILPEVRKPLSQIPVDGLFRRAAARAVVHFNMHPDHVARPFVQNHRLPVVADAVDTAQNIFEHPWADVAHAADDHFIAATAYFPRSEERRV